MRALLLSAVTSSHSRLICIFYCTKKKQICTTISKLLSCAQKQLTEYSFAGDSGKRRMRWWYTSNVMCRSFFYDTTCYQTNRMRFSFLFSQVFELYENETSIENWADRLVTPSTQSIFCVEVFLINLWLSTLSQDALCWYIHLDDDLSRSSAMDSSVALVLVHHVVVIIKHNHFIVALLLVLFSF